MQIAAPITPADYDAVRRLCWEYRDYLLTFPSPEVDYIRKYYSDDAYAQMMAEMEAEHTPPEGGCVLAKHGETALGCGMFHTLETGTAEIKRIYVHPSARGTGLGRGITQTLVDQCRAQGFSRILMDTSRRQIEAYRLYLSMGFEERGPYQDVPDDMIEKMYFFEMAL